MNTKRNPVQQAVNAYAVRKGFKEGRGVQKDISERLGCARQTVRNWCLSGSVSLNYVAQFSALTGAKPDDLNRELRRYSL